MLHKTNSWLSSSLTTTMNIKDYFQPFVRLLNSSWSRNNYIARVENVREEDSNTYTLVLKPSRNWKLYEAGQFVQLHIEIDGSLYTRTFSISSSPLYFKQKGLIEITIQKQSKGKVTPLLQELLVKDQYISISEAKGEFVCNQDSSPLLFIAAGSGITPIKSLIGELVTSSDRDIDLIYYASNDDHLFKQEFQMLESKFENLKINFINTSVESRINSNQLKLLCDDFDSREIFLCGPTAMIESTQSLLLDENINPEKIHFEYFGTAPIKELNIENKGKVTFQQSSIKIDTAKLKTSTLLEVAENSGLKPNSGCRMGVCHQCVCKKKQGVTYNTLTKTFSDTGAQEIQLCISVPVGDVVLDL
jgi:ferredoxin-NADP reductase